MKVRLELETTKPLASAIVMPTEYVPAAEGEQILVAEAEFEQPVGKPVQL